MRKKSSPSTAVRAVNAAKKQEGFYGILSRASTFPLPMRAPLREQQHEMPPSTTSTRKPITSTTTGQRVQRDKGGGSKYTPSPFVRGYTKNPNAGNNNMKKNNDSPMEVRVRNTAPPDPELLSKIGCRCLVIDFPGVLHENISASYIGGGYVRVEGKRTVGRVKSFRKKFPINQEQVVTRMLSAFLCEGVLVIVAPTKVAAAMAAAALVASRILAAATGNSVARRKPSPRRKKRLLIESAPQDNATGSGEEKDGPVKFSKDISATKDIARGSGEEDGPVKVSKDVGGSGEEDGPVKFSKDMSETTVASPIGVSAFDPVRVSTNSLPFDEAAVDPALKNVQARILYNKIHRKPDNLHLELGNQELNDTGKDTITIISLASDTEDQEKQKSPGQESKAESTCSSSEPSLGEKPAVWTDDSLREEPSVNATKSRRIMESIHSDSKRENRLHFGSLNLSPILSHLSPIPENPRSEDTSPATESPTDLSHSSDRPLQWVHFDSLWQEKEDSLMVDTDANHKRIERLHEGSRKVEGTNVRVGVPIMLPFEDELTDRNSNTVKMESLKPNPHWRSAPFMPRLPDSSPHSLQVLDSMNAGTIDAYSIDARGPALAYRESHQQREQRKQPPIPSLLRRKDKNEPSSPPGIIKSVSWVDEI